MAAIAIGCDSAGVELVARIREELASIGLEICDYGSAEDYPDVALRVARAIAAGTHERAILVCGTGIGMAIAANKVPGVYAAQVGDAYSAQRARKSNNAQIMTLGARVLGPELAIALVRIWLASEFQGGNSARKVTKIASAEREIQRGTQHL